MHSSEDLQASIQKIAAKPLSQGFEPEALHPYLDLEGNPLFYRVRLTHPETGQKWIRPIHLAGSSYVLGEPPFLEGKPLYFLNLLKEADHSIPIWLVEGEKCAEALVKLGLFSTTSGSADSVRSANWDVLQGRKVIIWRDFDEAGLHYAQEATQILEQLSCQVEWIEVENLQLPEKGDVIDWLALHPHSGRTEIENLPRRFPHLKQSLEVCDQWEAPVLFKSRKTPEIPARLLPGIPGEFAHALAEATESPQALAVMAVLGVLSACLTQYLVIQPKEGWEEPVNIYTLIALPPANNKSLVLNQATAPLILWEKEQAQILGPEIKKQKSERKTQERIIETRRAVAAKAESAKQQQLIEEIKNMESELIEPQALPRLFANDATPEALTQNAFEQGGRFAIFSDEGGILETLSGLYTRGQANVDILLKGFDGGDLRVSRKDRTVDFNPLLTIVLAVQPIILQKMAEKRAFHGNGLIERFLFVVPQSKVGFRTHQTPPVPITLKRDYQKKILDLLQMTQGNSKSSSPPRAFTLSQSALAEWQDFQKLIELQLRPEGKLHSCAGSGGKLCGIALRIAGLFHVAEFGLGSSVIQAPTMVKALELITLLSEHLLVAFDSMGADLITRGAKEIYEWILSEKRSEFRKTEVLDRFKNSRFGKTAVLNPSLLELIERNIIQSRREQTRKPTTVYEVNPLLLKGVK